ncbi:unnamed protein product, partial [Prorocentrum cordatum]
ERARLRRRPSGDGCAAGPRRQQLAPGGGAGRPCGGRTTPRAPRPAPPWRGRRARHPRTPRARAAAAWTAWRRSSASCSMRSRASARRWRRCRRASASCSQRNACEEYLNKLERRIQVIENKEVDTVQWRIENVEQVRSKHVKGQFLASPEFSACGLGGFRFHFYPRGDDFCDEGYCSVYFHVPSETSVTRTLFLGRARHGPADADEIKNCGVSEMCVLTNEIDKATGSIVIGVDGLKVLSSPHVVETRTKLKLAPLTT